MERARACSTATPRVAVGLTEPGASRRAARPDAGAGRSRRAYSSSADARDGRAAPGPTCRGSSSRSWTSTRFGRFEGPLVEGSDEWVLTATPPTRCPRTAARAAGRVDRATRAAIARCSTRPEERIAGRRARCSRSRYALAALEGTRPRRPARATARSRYRRGRRDRCPSVEVLEACAAAGPPGRGTLRRCCSASSAHPRARA